MTVEILSLARPTLKSAETRERIVRGALRVLETHGLGETTTRRIADEAGVRLATLHYHFASKETVLLAVLDTIISDLTEALDVESKPSATLAARIADVARASWAHVEATRAKQIVQYELTLYALRTKGSEWLAAQQYQAYVETYAGLLGRTQKKPFSAITPAEAETLARLLLAGIDGLILQSLAGAAAEQSRASLDALITSVQTRAKRFARRNRGETKNARHD